MDEKLDRFDYTDEELEEMKREWQEAIQEIIE